MFGIISLLLSLELILVFVKDLLSALSSLLFISYLFFIYCFNSYSSFFLLFVNNSLLIYQEIFFEKSNANLFCNYRIISFLFEQFSLVIKHDKSKIFHFSRVIKKYLGFFFDKKLSFWHYISYYANKALFTIKSMKMLGNSTRGLSPVYKHLLDKTCVLPITLYSFQLWYFKIVSLYQPLKELKKIQRRVAL